MHNTDRYDIIIIGSGMGGLACGDLLAREGYRVCILEKNKQIGGSLQTYARDRVVFDSGVHYIGALDKGQNLYQIFKYLGLMDKLKLQRMDEVFDKIIIEGDPAEYPYSQGYDNFIRNLLVYFPDEEKALQAYCDKIRYICSRFPMYNLRTGSDHEKEEVQSIDSKAYIESITDNKKLQAVLAGNNYLYAGVADKTPFYVHALILNHYIESAWKCIDGGSQIGKILARNIREQGGEVIRNASVARIAEEDGRVQYVELENGERMYADAFISNIHPAKTMEMLASPAIKPAYRKRLREMENSISSFAVNIVFKKKSFRYFSHNYYCHRMGEVWNMVNYTEENWPLGYCVFVPATSRGSEYAEGMTLLTYMRFDEVAAWKDTFNTVSAASGRGESYEQFKHRKAEKLISQAELTFPGLRNCIQSYYCSTPLSFRDYIGNDDGSMYGIAKDYKNPLKTFISPRTKLSNLYFTGQNLNLHGILGAAMSAVITCIIITGRDDIIEKIRNA